MQAKLQNQLSYADAEVILERLPTRIRAALLACAALSVDLPQWHYW
jgi:hypothetical protein